MVRVAVTGTGAITPIGNDVPTFWNNLKNGVVGITRVTLFDPTNYQCQVAAEVKNFDPLTAVEKKELKKLDPYSIFAAAAAKEAIAQAGLTESGYAPEEIGCVLGTGIGGIQFIAEQVRTMAEKGNRRVSPFFIPRTICNTAAGYVAIQNNLQGPCACPVTACATGTNALGEAWLYIRLGWAKAIVAGGTESSISDVAFAGFGNMQALSFRNEDPLQSCVPFDKRRDGFVMGEGAGVLVLENWDEAVKRGANILGEILGYGISCDAFHMTAPASDARGASRAMEMAIKSSGLALEQIGHVNAHGTSTPLNDKLETMAIKKVFGDHAKKLAISSNKSMLGHTIGAAGAIEAIAAIHSVKEGFVPPTMGYQEPDPELDLDYVPNVGREMDVKYAISNSFGFGGHNCSIVVGRA
jgi:3-oxoacyl-[acyl-carrier-protein] synthase II